MGSEEKISQINSPPDASGDTIPNESAHVCSRKLSDVSFRCRIANCTKCFRDESLVVRHIEQDFREWYDQIHSLQGSMMMEQAFTVETLLSSQSCLKMTEHILEGLPVELLLYIYDNIPDAASRACLALTSKYFYSLFHENAFAALQLPAEVTDKRIMRSFWSSCIWADWELPVYHTSRWKFLKRLERDEYPKAPEKQMTLCAGCFCFHPPQLSGQA